MSKLNSELLAQCVEDLLAYSQGKTISKEGESQTADEVKKGRKGGREGGVARLVAELCRAAATNKRTGTEWLTGLQREGGRRGGREACSDSIGHKHHPSTPYSPPLPPSLPPSFSSSRRGCEGQGPQLQRDDRVAGRERGRKGWKEGGRGRGKWKCSTWREGVMERGSRIGRGVAAAAAAAAATKLAQRDDEE